MNESGTQSDIADILGKMMEGPYVGNCNDKITQLLRHFQASGLTLKTCADNRHLGRAVKTLQVYARQASLKFPDYCPRHMKPKKAAA